jgi:predicted phage replisome organizer
VDIVVGKKARLIRDEKNGDKMLLIWVALLAEAARTNDNGYIYISENVPYSEKKLSKFLNFSEKILKKSLEIFKNYQMIEINDKGILILEWENHQSTEKLNRIRANTKKRVAKYRQNKINVTQDVTQEITQCNAVDKDKDKDKDKDLYIGESEKNLITEIFLDERIVKFQSTFKEILKKPCSINQEERKKLVEVLNDFILNGENLETVINQVLQTLSKIEFSADNPIKPSINWLLKENNFYRVYNGEFKTKESTENKKEGSILDYAQ